tara:strand:+ start:646 stop:1386 length:741 start_codon:yes stop_codon:yes gene_type:complete
MSSNNNRKNNKVSIPLDDETKEWINQPRTIVKTCRWKLKPMQGLNAEYTYKEGQAKAIAFEEGDDNDVNAFFEYRPISLLVHHPTGTRVLWERHKGESTSILVVDVLKFKQARNPFKMQKVVDKALDIIWNVQGYKSCFARAALPRNDKGVRQKEDWRMKDTVWRMRKDCQRPIYISKLMKLWLTLIKYSAPAQLVNENHSKDMIVILNPDILKQLPREEVQNIEESIGKTGRKWSFMDCFEQKVG